MGTIELEAGVSVDDADAVDSPLTLKWGAIEAAELFVGWSPYVSVEAQGGHASSIGDLVIGTRVRFMEQAGGRPAAAFQFAAKLPVADEDEGLGSGEVDVASAGIVTKTIDRTTLVGYYQASALGSPYGSGVDIAHGLAVAAAHPIVQNLGGFVEFSGVLTPDQDSEALVTTLGVGYAIRPSLVLDAAVLAGLTSDASDFVFTVGTTMNFGSLVRQIKENACWGRLTALPKTA